MTSRRLSLVAGWAMAAATFNLAPAAAGDAAQTLMVLNVSVDISNVTGDNGTFLVVCKVTQGNAVKQNFLDGHAFGNLIHDQVNGQYVARFNGVVRVEMKEDFIPPAFDLAKLDSYYCRLQMQADGNTNSANNPTINGPLPAPGDAVQTVQ
jgi:hypothetical protein